jgi:hypothetical protein
MPLDDWRKSTTSMAIRASDYRNANGKQMMPMGQTRAHGCTTIYMASRSECAIIDDNDNNESEQIMYIDVDDGDGGDQSG